VRALATDPSVLLLDEPFAALDAQTREVLQEELLRVMQQERKTMVFVTHSIDEAILLGDRVAVLSARPGRLREMVEVPFGRPRQVDEVRGDPRFAELREHIWSGLRPEAAAAV
jgi:NitT/TauT family transport system ATP-binding protein